MELFCAAVTDPVPQVFPPVGHDTLYQALLTALVLALRVGRTRRAYGRKV